MAMRGAASSARPISKNITEMTTQDCCALHPDAYAKTLCSPASSSCPGRLRLRSSSLLGPKGQHDPTIVADSARQISSFSWIAGRRFYRPSMRDAFVLLVIAPVFASVS